MCSREIYSAKILILRQFYQSVKYLNFQGVFLVSAPLHRQLSALISKAHGEVGFITCRQGNYPALKCLREGAEEGDGIDSKGWRRGRDIGQICSLKSGEQKYRSGGIDGFASKICTGFSRLNCNSHIATDPIPRNLHITNPSQGTQALSNRTRFDACDFLPN